MMFFILKSTHNDRIALKDQRIAELEADIETLIEQRKMAEDVAKQRWNEIQTLEATNADQSLQNRKLFERNMQLAVQLDACIRRPRGAGGRFVSVKQTPQVLGTVVSA